ncbi:HEAT repeat domain-containing protein [Myxococcus sp. CA051A]|uniref:HEAT repeat domain-containing protein n=2 Tax=Myxococcaceae TaxID=31 RepID=UPI00157BADE0|nr:MULTISPECIES: HEAT repeat domain-containing protein [unclassified Myxococcus]NTX14326.1 HEAT repeat domain-containing protein [Myxococcus sp. CA056]NTX41302.1 HEAT repeat domain-containing protein [Myxococcus sp. CA033]NTX67151.1 HEAT repeat domain-containing protein [Myxococcus sp. CA051A]
MSPLLVAGLLLVAAAPARTPAPAASRPAPTSSRPAPAPPEPPAPVASADDTALLRALLWAARPAPEEVRAIAVEDLALLGDPRALDSLATHLWDPNPRTQQAVLRAVALFQHPRAEEILGNVVRHPRMPDALKIQALNGLVFQRTASARRTVQDAATDSRLTSVVQNAARAVAEQWNAPPASR